MAFITPGSRTQSTRSSWRTFFDINLAGLQKFGMPNFSGLASSALEVRFSVSQSASQNLCGWVRDLVGGSRLGEPSTVSRDQLQETYRFLTIGLRDKVAVTLGAIARQSGRN